MSFCLAFCICVYVFDILNKTKQQQKVETSYWFVVSLKYFLSATESLNRIKNILLGLVLVIFSGASLKRGFSFTYCYPQKRSSFKTPNSLTYILSSFNGYDVTWFCYIVYLLRIQYYEYFYCYLLTAVYKSFSTVSANMIHVKTFVKNNCLTNFLLLYPVSNSWLSLFMESLLCFAFCVPQVHMLSSLLAEISFTSQTLETSFKFLSVPSLHHW